MKKNILMLSVVCIVLSACKKEPEPKEDEDPVNNQSCYVTNWDSFKEVDNSGYAFGEVKTQYVYDEKGRMVSQIINDTSKFSKMPKLRQFEYTSDRIIVKETPSNNIAELSFFDNKVTKYSFAVDFYFLVYYSKDSYISKIDQHVKGNGELSTSREFNYENGNLKTVISKSGMGTIHQYVDTIALEYYMDKKAIEGVELGLNKLIMPQWLSFEYSEPFQFPTGVFGKSSINLLKEVKYHKMKRTYNFSYEFDNGKPISILYNEKGFGMKRINLKYNCKD